MDWGNVLKSVGGILVAAVLAGGGVYQQQQGQVSEAVSLARIAAEEREKIRDQCQEDRLLCRETFVANCVSKQKGLRDTSVIATLPEFMEAWK